MQKNELPVETQKTIDRMAEFAEETKKAFLRHGFDEDEAFAMTKVVMKQVLKHKVKWKASEYEY